MKAEKGQRDVGTYIRLKEGAFFLTDKAVQFSEASFTWDRDMEATIRE